jgi:membrane protein YqaA with SNARE-associated domain
VVGGVVGWYLGFAVQNFVSDMLQLLPNQIAGPEKFYAVSVAFDKFGIILVLIGAFTPLPYKVIAISAGLFGYALLPFVIFSLIGRGVRFSLVAGLVAHRHDYRLVVCFLSALLLLLGTGMWLVS